MKYRRTLLGLIGGWLLFIVIDTAHGRLGSIGARSLPRPLKGVWFLTQTLHTIALFVLAVATYLFILQNRDGEKKTALDNKRQESSETL